MPSPFPLAVRILSRARHCPVRPAALSGHACRRPRNQEVRRVASPRRALIIALQRGVLLKAVAFEDRPYNHALPPAIQTHIDAADELPRITRSGHGAVKAATLAILCGLVGLAAWFSLRWWAIERVRRTRNPGTSARPGAEDCAVGFVTNFFDALGIGNFAPTTAYYKMRRRVADENIPGTLNVGHSLPVVVEALVFISVVAIDVVTLAAMIASAVLGAWLGVGVVARMPRRAIQIGMGAALLVAGALFAAKNVNWLPGGGAELGLHGGRLLCAIAVNFVLGALMMLGIGLYAPCLMLVSLLGMNPVAAFPIMMGSCAFLMPIGGVRFARTGRYELSAALGLTLGGVPAVLIAVYLVKSMPITWLRWLVVVVVFYAAALMLRSAIAARPQRATAGEPLP